MQKSFVACPAAWIVHESKASSRNSLFKYFTPEVVEEALQAEYDETTQRVITPSEKEANEE